jgi:acetolactate synthase regulatory subunit
MASLAVAAATPVAARPALQSVKALFYITAAADPGLLPRLIEPVAKLGHVPARVHASRESGDGSELTVDLRLASVTPRSAQLVENSLRAVVGVRQVIAVVEPAD